MRLSEEIKIAMSATLELFRDHNQICSSEIEYWCKRAGCGRGASRQNVDRWLRTDNTSIPSAVQFEVICRNAPPAVARALRAAVTGKSEKPSRETNDFNGDGKVDMRDSTGWSVRVNSCAAAVVEKTNSHAADGIITPRESAELLAVSAEAGTYLDRFNGCVSASTAVGA